MRAWGTSTGEATPQSLHFRLGAWGERLLLAFLVLLFVARGFIPAWSHLGSDFPNYYLVARLFHQKYPLERVYEWTWFQRQKDHAGIERPLVGFIPSTLPSALIVLPLAFLSPLQANRCWLVLTSGFLLLVAVLLKRVTSLTLRRVGVLMFLAVGPLRSNFLLGQVHVVVLFLLVLAAWLYLKDLQFLCGAVVASAAAIEICLVLFFVFFVVKKRWYAACGFVAGTASASLLSIYLFGAEACRTYLRGVFPWVLRGEIVDPYDPGWNSMDALLRKLFLVEPELNPFPVAHLPSLYAFLHSLIHASIVIAFLWAVHSKSPDRSRRKLEWASYTFLALLLSSAPFPYHFVTLILTACLVVDYLVVRRQLAWAVISVVLYVFVCMPYDRLYRINTRGWKTLLLFPRLSFMILLGGVLWWLLIRSFGEPLGNRLRTRALMLGVFWVVAVTAGGVLLNLRHLAGQFDNYRTRVTKVVGSAIAADPEVTADSVFFGALVPRFSTSGQDAYAVYRLRAGSITSYGGRGDWFHPAVMNDTSTCWAEVATKNGSQVVRFNSADHGTQGPAYTVEATDAEQPAISPTGGLLAFIREVQGRGSLWVRRIGREESQAQPSTERELAGAQYDVHEAAFFPEGAILFSSRQRGGFRLYRVDSYTGSPAQISAVTCSARYPSVSPDGKWMAYSCERAGLWQLLVMNLGTQEQRQLTTSDCNSITPTWVPGSRDLIFATDCGRALGITALSRLTAVR